MARRFSNRPFLATFTPPLSQEAFVRFWRHQRPLPGEPMALLVTSVRRAAIDLGRGETRRTARE
jgi:DNA-directed RNA polymerase specialized sigma24 family protein